MIHPMLFSILKKPHLANQPPHNKLILEICEHFNISKLDFESKTRMGVLTTARGLFCFILREKYGNRYTWDSIGELMGGKAHSTAIHHFNKIISYIQVDDIQALKHLEDLLGKDFQQIYNKYKYHGKNRN
jgi:chromosomal replication initiation ATPase DnaA